VEQTIRENILCIENSQQFEAQGNENLIIQ